MFIFYLVLFCFEVNWNTVIDKLTAYNWADCFKLLQNQTMSIKSSFWSYVDLTSWKQQNKRSSCFVRWYGWSVTLHSKTLKTCRNLFCYVSKLLFKTKAERNGMQSPGGRHRYCFIKSKAYFHCCLLPCQAFFWIHTWDLAFHCRSQHWMLLRLTSKHKVVRDQLKVFCTLLTAVINLSHSVFLLFLIAIKLDM